MPAAAPAAVVAGDPCFDRLRASLQFRARYRKALGVGTRTLIFVSSTWSSDSVLGARIDLLRELLAELPRDSYVLAACLHPNISHRHGPGQIKHWFADCRRAGLVLLDETTGWRAGIVAADIAIGDHGSVNAYCAAIGTPTLLAAFPDVPEATPVAELGTMARRLPLRGPYRPVLEDALRTHHRDRFDPVTALVTSEPGRSLHLLRNLFYRLLELSPPDCETPVHIVPEPTTPPRTESFADTVVGRMPGPGATVELERCSAELSRYRDRWDDGDTSSNRHLCCSVDYPIRTLREKANVLVGSAADTGDPHAWLQETLNNQPSCTLAAIGSGDWCLVRTRRGHSAHLRGAPPEVSASAWHVRTARDPDSVLSTQPIHVRVGGIRYEIAVGPPNHSG